MIPESQFTPDMRELYDLMSTISEWYSCSGWNMGCEAVIWEAIRYPDILDESYDLALAKAHELSNRLQGWIIWHDDEDEPDLPIERWGPRFIGLPEWEAMYQEKWGGDKHVANLALAA